MPSISTVNEVVNEVKAESALEKAAAIIPSKNVIPAIRLKLLIARLG